MLLQDAMILGDTMKRCDSGQWISPDGSCGCALGGALLAAGVTAEEFAAQYGVGAPVVSPYEWLPEMECVKSRWPWLTGDHISQISDLYMEVECGEATIEDVAAYVKTIEPATKKQIEACIFPPSEFSSDSDTSCELNYARTR